MKKILLTLLLLLALPIASHAAVHVNGYFKSNGTYVAPYYRSNPDGNPYNNWSFPGNTNPYTGKTATGNADTYLNNYYGTSGSSFPSYTSPSFTLPTYTSPTLPTYTSPDDSYSSYSVPDKYSCPSNASYNYAKDGCYCNSGYSNNSTKTGCEVSIPTCPANSTYDGKSSCYCNTGWVTDSTKTTCVVEVQPKQVVIQQESDCSAYGAGSLPMGKFCFCGKGYHWDVAVTSCEVGSASFTQRLKIGSTGTEVLNLKNQLAAQGWFFNTDPLMRGAFDAATAAALVNYQKSYGIAPTGQVGPATRKALNLSAIIGY